MCFLLDFFLSARYLCPLCLYVVTDLDTAIAFGILSGQKDWQPHWKRLLPLQPSKGLGLSLFQLAFKGCGAFQTARIFSNRGRAIAKKSPGASSWAGFFRWIGRWCLGKQKTTRWSPAFCSSATIQIYANLY